MALLVLTDVALVAALAAALALLLRKRMAVWLFALSLTAIVITHSYEFARASPIWPGPIPNSAGFATGVIVTQIAATVLFTAMAYVVQRQAAGIASAKAAFPAEEYLAVRLEIDRDSQEGRQLRSTSPFTALRSHHSRVGTTSCRGAQSRRCDPGRAAPVDAVGRRRDRARRPGSERVGDR